MRDFYPEISLKFFFQCPAGLSITSKRLASVCSMYTFKGFPAGASNIYSNPSSESNRVNSIVHANDFIIGKLDCKLDMVSPNLKKSDVIVSDKRTKTQQDRMMEAERWLLFAYRAQCIGRTLLEIMFLVLQMLMFGFQVPALYKCNAWPCPDTVLLIYLNLVHLHLPI